MISENYFVNHPVFLKYKRRFDWKKLRKRSFLKRVVVNERIIEIPFAIKALVKSINEGGEVLDLGCMESSLPLFLAGLGFQVTGFDFREYPYVMPNFEFVRGDILDLPFDDSTFDAVTCVSTIEHIGIGFYNDPKRTMSADIKGMEEARRVLKPKGVLVLTVPFGKAHINDQQRVYDAETLEGLLSGCEVIEEKFFKNVSSGQGNNYWQKITKGDSADMVYDAGTDCVACIVAVKKS